MLDILYLRELRGAHIAAGGSERAAAARAGALVQQAARAGLAGARLAARRARPPQVSTRDLQKLMHTNKDNIIQAVPETDVKSKTCNRPSDNI